MNRYKNISKRRIRIDGVGIIGPGEEFSSKRVLHSTILQAVSETLPEPKPKPKKTK